MTDCDWEAVDAQFCEICEKTGFLLADPTPTAALPVEAGPLAVATVGFTGVALGTVEVAGPLATVAAMVANLLEDSDDTEAQARALLMELANIAAGCFLGVLTGGQGQATFSPPMINDLDASAWRDLLADPASRGYLADEGPLVLRCRVDP